jgi:uncharacterized RDD family membrane protein YckC
MRVRLVNSTEAHAGGFLTYAVRGRSLSWLKKPTVGSDGRRMDSAPESGAFGSEAVSSGPAPAGGFDSGQPRAAGSEPVAFTGESPAGSVAPPGWSPSAPPILTFVPPAPSLPAEPAYRALARSTPADAAIRWRFGAAFLDNLAIYGGYVLLCLAVHWRVATPAHAAVLLALSVLYHFVFEANGGQTPGKRRYGVRVVSVDGGPADARAIAVRSVLRLIDQLPVWYASGLVSMIRTGPERRQRIGDVAARTMVVAVDGHAARSGTRGWVLPTATMIAVLLSTWLLISLRSGVNFMGIQLTSGASQALTDQQRADFITGCENTGGAATSCVCILNQLEADGYGTIDRLRSLMAQTERAAADRNPGELPLEVMKAARVCGLSR